MKSFSNLSFALYYHSGTEHKIVSETIGLRLKIIVAITTYAPADRFFRIELSRVFEATIYGISIHSLLTGLYQKFRRFSINFSFCSNGFLYLCNTNRPLVGGRFQSILFSIFSTSCSDLLHYSF